MFSTHLCIPKDYFYQLVRFLAGRLRFGEAFNNDTPLRRRAAVLDVLGRDFLVPTADRNAFLDFLAEKAGMTREGLLAVPKQPLGEQPVVSRFDVDLGDVATQTELETFSRNVLRFFADFVLNPQLTQQFTMRGAAEVRRIVEYLW